MTAIDIKCQGNNFMVSLVCFVQTFLFTGKNWTVFFRLMGIASPLLVCTLKAEIFTEFQRQDNSHSKLWDNFILSSHKCTRSRDSDRVPFPGHLTWRCLVSCLRWRMMKQPESVFDSNSWWSRSLRLLTVELLPHVKTWYIDQRIVRCLMTKQRYKMFFGILVDWTTNKHANNYKQRLLKASYHITTSYPTTILQHWLASAASSTY